MTEDEIRSIILNTLNEKIQPLINKMAEVISEAYETGIAVGVQIAQQLGNNRP
jgi:hypothetical protein